MELLHIVAVNLFRTPPSGTIDLKQRLIDHALPRKGMLMHDLCEAFCCAAVALLLKAVLLDLVPEVSRTNRATVCNKARKV